MTNKIVIKINGDTITSKDAIKYVSDFSEFAFQSENLSSSKLFYDKTFIDFKKTKKGKFVFKLSRNKND